ncbi:MAG: hypothetical protein ACYCPT_11920 [Acidimicrobiales bacterium]
MLIKNSIIKIYMAACTQYKDNNKAVAAVNNILSLIDGGAYEEIIKLWRDAPTQPIRSTFKSPMVLRADAYRYIINFMSSPLIKDCISINVYNNDLWEKLAWYIPETGDEIIKKVRSYSYKYLGEKSIIISNGIRIVNFIDLESASLVYNISFIVMMEDQLITIKPCYTLRGPYVCLMLIMKANYYL